MMPKKILLLLCLIWVTNANGNEIVACIDDHPPYQILADIPHGSHITALEKLAKVLEKQLKFIRSPNFARCVAMLSKGHVDVIAGLTPTEERGEFAFFAPFKKADALRVISKNGINIKNYSDFKGKIIGVARGSTYFPRFDNDNNLDKISIQNIRIGITLMKKNRIDLIMVSPATLATFSKEIAEEKFIVSPMELEELRDKETSFGFSKAHQLTMTNQEIKDKVYAAYQQGRFQ